MSTSLTYRTTSVYNFDVEEFHTYFVGNAGLWVHNVSRFNMQAASGGKTGTYTNTHQSDTKYHGKGSERRMKQSAAERAEQHKDPVLNSEHTPASTSREAFKEEHRRINADGGPGAGNYNEINSPGKKMLEKDGK